MKKCGTKNCPVPEGKQEFNKNKAKKDGLNSICKVCSRARSKRYYSENTEHHKEVVNNRNKKLKREVLINLYDYLSNKSCAHCPENDPIVLEFDHLRDKHKSISELVSQKNSWGTILKEIEKCQVLCANCHRRKTATDQNWFVLEYLKNKNGSLA